MIITFFFLLLKASNDQVEIVSVHSVNTPTVEELFPVTSNVSSSSMDSTSRSGSINTSRARSFNGMNFTYININKFFNKIFFNK